VHGATEIVGFRTMTETSAATTPTDEAEAAVVTPPVVPTTSAPEARDLLD